MSYAKPPVLSGTAKTDYENYLRTDQLLSLQKGPDEWKHRDELLFTVVHQASELWLKLATSEITEAVEQLRKNNLREPQRLLSRAVLCIQQTYNALELLEKMSPWDYQKVRSALGHGSGFDSPGFNGIRKVIPQLRNEFERIMSDSSISLFQLYIHDRKYEDLYQLAEWLIQVDEQISMWRHRHIKVVERTIGKYVNGTQGTPVEMLERLTSYSFFPDLIQIRTDITTFAMNEDH